MPAAHIASIEPNPTVMPSIWGMDRLKPNMMPEEVSMMLFGPGVIEETKANSASGSRDSMVFSFRRPGRCRCASGW